MALVAVAVAVLRRAWSRTLLVLLSVVLLVASALQGVNAYYGYYPTLSEALGGPSPGEVSLADVESGADSGTIPATGQVVPIDIPGTVSGFDARQALVYLPPAWSAKPRPTLPVILLLHGTPGDPSNWTDGGDAQATADAWAAAHRGVAPVLVMPDINGSLTGDTECVDSSLGNAETYLTVDVPAAVQAAFGTARPGRGWAVAGLSEGGTCSIMLALRHPTMFSAFGDFGGLVGPREGESNGDIADTVTDLFGGSQQAFDAHEPSTLLKSARFPNLGGWFQVGSDDAAPLAAIQQLLPLSKAAGLHTCYVEMPGQGHTFDVWSAAFRRSLPWLVGRLGLVRQTNTCP